MLVFNNKKIGRILWPQFVSICLCFCALNRTTLLRNDPAKQYNIINTAMQQIRAETPAIWREKNSHLGRVIETYDLDCRRVGSSFSRSAVVQFLAVPTTTKYDPVLAQCWAGVADAGPTLCQNCSSDHDIYERGMRDTFQGQDQCLMVTCPGCGIHRETLGSARRLSRPSDHRIPQCLI